VFTIEMDFDETAITVLDDSGKFEDVQYVLYDDYVFIRQWDEKANKFNVIAMTPEMFGEFVASLKLPEGAYKFDLEDKND